MNQNIRFSVQLTLKDYRNFNYYYMYSGSRGFLFGFIAVILLLNVIMRIFFLPEGGELFSLTNILLIGAVVFVILVPVLLFFQTKRIFNADKFLQEKQDYMVSGAGIEVKTANSQAKVDWEKIFRIRENSKYLLVFLSPNKAFIIPKKDVASEIDEVKKILSENLDRKQLKIKQ